jgi:hypothetical protein
MTVIRATLIHLCALVGGVAIIVLLTLTATCEKSTKLEDGERFDCAFCCLLCRFEGKRYD